MLRNIMVVSGAKNCVYDILAIEDKYFELIFVGSGQNIEFADDFINALEKKRAFRFFNDSGEGR